MTTCPECGAAVTQPKRGQRRQFCCDAHRRAFNNRRQMRGAQLADMFMALRYDRDAANEAGVWGFMCRMAEAWRNEDREAGRESFGDYQKFMAENMHLNPSAVVRLPSMRFKRRAS